MTKRQKRGCLLIFAGLIMVFAAAQIHQLQEKQDAMAGENAQILLQQLELNKLSMEATTPSTPTEGEEPSNTETLPQETLPGMVIPDRRPTTQSGMPEKEFLGYTMIGTLRIPAVGIQLPVLSSWSYKLLNAAPCRYTGTVKDENLIIMGHNYKSHFTPLHSIQVGAAVEFEDVNGMVYRYTVEKIEYLHKSQGEQLPSEYPLTLFTCTAGGQNRIIVRCSKTEYRDS